MNKDTVMRMYRSSLWLTVAIAIWCCTPMLGIAVAQYPGPDAGIFEQPAGEAATAPGTAYSGPMESGAMMAAPPGGMPNDANSLYYPQMSPYAHNYDQTYNLNGMWFNNSNNYPRRYEFGLEYLNATFMGPGTDLVGDPEAFRLGATHVTVGTGSQDPFITWNVSHLGPETSNGMRGIGSNGIRAHFNIVNPDDRVLMTDLFGVGPSDSVWRPRPAADFSTFASLQSTISAMGTIPFDNGLDEGNLGAPAEFDAEYKLGYQASAWGGNVDWAPNAFLHKGALKVRAMYGLSFTRVSEEFTFDGIQTNYGYVIDTTGDIIDGTVVDVGDAFTYSNMYSRTTSYVAGPQIGLRYDLGGDKIKFWGTTRAGVGVNYETIRLGGNNMYDSFQRSIDGLDPNLTPTVDNPNPGAFFSQERHTHISPIFQQQLFAEAPVFQLIPVIRKMHIMREANFRIGYNFLLIGEMARPTKIIDYQEYEPKIDLSRSRWAMGSTSFAIDWKY